MRSQKRDLLFVFSILLLLTTTQSARSILLAQELPVRGGQAGRHTLRAIRPRQLQQHALLSRRKRERFDGTRPNSSIPRDSLSSVSHDPVGLESMKRNGNAAEAGVNSSTAFHSDRIGSRLHTFFGRVKNRFQKRKKMSHGVSESLENLRESSITKQVLYDELERAHVENLRLVETVENLKLENERLVLEKEATSLMGLETFEREGQIRKAKAAAAAAAFNEVAVELTLQQTVSTEVDEANLWCDALDDDSLCPVEPTVSFSQALRDRAYWLVGLLIMQSCSGVILARNEALLANHPALIYYLTMIVGAGGNSGNQSAVRVIRGLALDTLNDKTVWQFLNRELKMAMCLSGILSVVGFGRAVVFSTPLPEALAVTAALAFVVFSSVCLGAVLPLALQRVGVDPAHSSTTIQVVMDILGVVLTVLVSSALLESSLGTYIISALTGSLF